MIATMRILSVDAYLSEKVVTRWRFCANGIELAEPASFQIIHPGRLFEAEVRTTDGAVIWVGDTTSTGCNDTWLERGWTFKLARYVIGFIHESKILRDPTH